MKPATIWACTFLAASWIWVGCGEQQSEPAGEAVSAGPTALPEPAITWQPRHYVANRAEEPLELDGQLEDAEWSGARWSSDFIDIEGGSAPAPGYRTRVKMLWDDSYFYIAAELEEPHLQATLTERDSVIYHDNDFELFIDPDGDTHNYFELEVNALGTEWDLLLVKPYRDGGPAIDGWDIGGLRTAIFLDGTLNDPTDEDRGWTVEIALPWEALAEAAGRPAPPQPGDLWRVNFSRVEWQTEIVQGGYLKLADPQSGIPLAESNWVWSPQGLINMHYPEMWGFVQFSAEGGQEDPQTAFAPPDGDALWLLRQIYYRQRNHFAKHGSYAEDLAALDLDRPPLEGYEWPPLIETTPSMFEASIAAQDDRTLHIAQDGRTW